MEVIYFELNNWMPVRDYPEIELCEKMVGMFNEEDIALLDNPAWVLNNKLVVVNTLVDMSSNYCVSAPKEWVIENCPKLLTIHREFLRFPDADGELPEGRFGSPFFEYTDENIGCHIMAEREDNDGYTYYEEIT